MSYFPMFNVFYLFPSEKNFFFLTSRSIFFTIFAASTHLDDVRISDRQPAIRHCWPAGQHCPDYVAMQGRPIHRAHLHVPRRGPAGGAPPLRPHLLQPPAAHHPLLRPPRLRHPRMDTKERKQVLTITNKQ